MNYRTIAVKEELYNLIKDRAKKGCRGISNQVEYEFMSERKWDAAINVKRQLKKIRW